MLSHPAITNPDQTPVLFWTQSAIDWVLFCRRAIAESKAQRGAT